MVLNQTLFGEQVSAVCLKIKVQKKYLAEFDTTKTQSFQADVFYQRNTKT